MPVFGVLRQKEEPRTMEAGSTPEEKGTPPHRIGERMWVKALPKLLEPLLLQIMSYNEDMARYREKFIRKFPNPWKCVMCEKRIKTKEDLHVHHKDHNPENNEIENLVPMHVKCHKNHHEQAEITATKRRESHKGKTLSKEQKEKMAVARTNFWASLTPEARAEMGRKQSEGRRKARAKRSQELL